MNRLAGGHEGRTRLVLLVASLAYLAVAHWQFREIGQIHEEISPHMRYLPRILEPVRAVGSSPHLPDEAGDLPPAVRFSHPQPEELGPGCHVVLSSQWPTFSVVCAGAVFPILSEVYQGNWLYYASYAWQHLFGDSLAAIRFFCSLFGVAGIWLLFFVVRREAGATAGLLAGLMLAGNVFQVASFGLGFLFETVPALLALASYAALQGAGDRGPRAAEAGSAHVAVASPPPDPAAVRAGAGHRWGPSAWFLLLSLFLLSAAFSLKATVGILLFPFLFLYSTRTRHLRLPRRWWLAAGLAFALPLLPYALHEAAVMLDGRGDSSLLAYLVSRGHQISDPARLPGMLANTLVWLLTFGGNLNAVSGTVFGVEARPWPRVDLVVLMACSLAWAGVRWWRGRARPLEIAAILFMAAAFLESVMLYSTDTDVQAFAYVLPFLAALNALFAARVGEWLAGRSAPRLATVAPFLLAALYASQLIEPLLDSREPPAAMASKAAQEEVCRALKDSAERGERPEVATTEYNHIGFIERCTGQTIRPLHGYFLLSPGSVGERLEADLEAGSAALLDRLLAAASPAPGSDPYVLVDLVSSRVWEAREGSVLAGEQSLTRARFEALDSQAAARGLSLDLVHTALDRQGRPVMGLLRLLPGRR